MKKVPLCNLNQPWDTFSPQSQSNGLKTYVLIKTT